MKVELLDNSLHNLSGGTWNHRPIITINKNIDFLKLRLLAGEINSLIHDRGFMENNLHLFGDNYEHNTDDDLLKVLGWNNENYIIETGNLVGFISSKQLQLSITSRFGISFLTYLLCYTEGLLEIPDAGTISDDGLFEWVIVFLWKTALQKAFRLGIPKQYITQSEKLFSVKGNVDVLDYAIYRNMDGKLLCNYHQYDYNNPVTQLISYTFSKIDKKELIKDCIQLKNAFETCVGGKRVTLSTCLNTRLITNPYYSDYNKVVRLSKNILRKKYGGLDDSSNITSAFLFDMSMLFEYFIRKVLLANDIKLFPKNEESMTISRGLGKDNDRHLYPDIIIKRAEKQIEVYDVKYKHFDSSYGVSRNDLFQLHTYVSYLSNDYDVIRCGIIYPQAEGENKGTNNTIRHPKYSNNIQFNVLLFRVPMDQSNMNNMKERMEQSIKEFISNFK